MIAAAVGVLTLAACSSEESLSGGEAPQDVARFSATIAGPGTRAYDQIWEANDGIGISGTSGDVAYTNVHYRTTDAGGTFTPADESGKIYFQDNNEVTFTAYYPWNELQGGSTAITADTREQANRKTFDFLWAQAKGSKASPNVQFQFAHKMAKVVLTIKQGDDVDYDEVKAAVLKLEGFRPEGTFDVTNGTTATTGDALSSPWTFSDSALKKENAEEGTVSYTLILFPQTFDAALPFTAELTGKQSFKADLNFTNANAEKDGEHARNEWVAGRQYNMGIVLNKTGIEVEGCTITKWEEVNGGDVDAQ